MEELIPVLKERKIYNYEHILVTPENAKKLKELKIKLDARSNNIVITTLLQNYAARFPEKQSTTAVS